MASPPVIKIRLIPSGRALRQKIAKLNPAKQTKLINRALIRSGLVIARNAQNQMIRGGSGLPHPTRLTSRSGTGRRSITADRRVSKTTQGFRLDVGTSLVYMGVHETGGTFSVPAHTRTSKLGKSFSVSPYTATFPKRAFLEPGLKKSRIAIENIFTEEWRRLAGSI